MSPDPLTLTRTHWGDTVVALLCFGALLAWAWIDLADWIGGLLAISGACK